MPLNVPIPVLGSWAVKIEEISCDPAAKAITKNPVLSLFSGKLYKQIRDDQSKRYHGHQIYRRITDFIPFQRGQKPQINHMSQDGQGKKRLFICFCQLNILEKMGSIKNCS